MNKIFLIGIIIGTIVIICSIVSMPLEGKKGSGTVREEKVAEEMEDRAYIIAQSFVKDRLKSPKTAEFSFECKCEYNMSTKTYYITSFVDAQNSFGALLRMNFVCRLKFNGGDWADINNWNLLEIVTY